jgi:uncharacterized protein (DUF433 family)
LNEQIACKMKKPSERSWKDVITFDPEKCGGRPCIRSMRIRVIDNLELLAAGLTPEQVIDELPDLTKEDIAGYSGTLSRAIGLLEDAL